MAGIKHVTEKQPATHVRSRGRQDALPIALHSSFFHSIILIFSPSITKRTHFRAPLKMADGTYMYGLSPTPPVRNEPIFGHP